MLSTLSFLMFFTDDGRRLGEDGCTVATGGGAPCRLRRASYRLLPDEATDAAVDPETPPRFTAL